MTLNNQFPIFAVWPSAMILGSIYTKNLKFKNFKINWTILQLMNNETSIAKR